MDLRGIWSEQESRENIFAKNPPSLTSFEIPDSLLEEIQFELKSTLNGQSVAEECETNCFHRHHHNQYHHHHCHHHHRHHHHHIHHQYHHHPGAQCIVSGVPCGWK